MSAARAIAAKAHMPVQAAPPAVQAIAPRALAAMAPMASLTAIPSGPSVQRKCASCEEEQSAVQPRLEVGPVGDRYEQEADSIAAQVMAMRDSEPSAASDAVPAVQRACAACSASSDDELRARRMGGEDRASEEDELKVRARREGGPETIAASDSELTSGGAALPAGTRSFFETRMGRDLGDVRVHQGGQSAAMNASISARAFTYKNHVWLGAGETAGPSFTMAHELAHVMQQTAPGPVGPQARREASEASEAAPGVQRSSPFFMQTGKTAPSHAKMHEVAQANIRKHNSDMLTEVPIPGANRKVVSLGKCGFADFYTATPIGGIIPVPGVESVESAPASGITKLQNFTESVSKSSCVGTIAFGTAKRGQNDYPLDPARGPVVDSSGGVGKLSSAPTGVMVGELKPAHDINYRGSGVTQIDNYIAGINAAAAETNKALPAGQSWNPSPSRWTAITLPPGWDAAGQDAGSKWPIPDLMIRDYAKAPASTPVAKKKAKTKGKAAASSKDVQSGSNVKISGRWMLAKDSTRVSDGDGVYVYFLAPKPDDLTRALKSRKTSAEFRKLSAKVKAVYKPLLATPDVKKAARKQALAAPRRRPSPTPAPKALRYPPLRPRVQRKAVDPFDRKSWELLRTGEFKGETQKGSLAELFATTPSEQLRDEAAVANGIAEWLRAPPETAKGVTYSKEGAGESDAASEDFDTLRKAAFWAGPLAAPIGLLRERFGQMFIKGHAAFLKVKKKIRSVFKNAKFSAGSGSGIGAHAAKIVGKIFIQLGKVVLARTADLIVQCLQSGFAAFMQKQVEGSVEELIAKAEEAKLSVEKLKDEVEQKIKAALESVIGDYEARIKEIADDAKLIAAIASAVSEIVRLARIIFCLSGLSAAGWGAIATCLLSAADWIASKFDASPLDAVIKRVMGSCEGRKLLAEALIGFEAVRTLPTLLAKTILRPIKENLPSPADEMLCDIDKISVPDLTMADFECKSGGDGDSEGEGGEGAAGSEDTADEAEAEEGGGGGGEQTGSGAPGTEKAGTEKPGSGGQSGASGEGESGNQQQASKNTSPAGSSSVSGGAVTKGDPDTGNGIIESGIDASRSYKNERVKVRVTINLGEHVIRDQPCTIIVTHLGPAAGGGKLAYFYFPDEQELIDKEGTFEINYPDDPSRNYRWSPRRGKTNGAAFKIRGSGQ